MTPGTAGHDELADFTPGARRALLLAEQEARLLGHEHVGTEHLLLGLMAGDDEAAAALREAGAGLPATRRKVQEAVGAGVPGATEPTASPRASRAIGRAPRFARAQHAGGVASQHLLLAVLDVEGTAGQVLRGMGIDVEHLRASLGATSPAAPGDAVEPLPSPTPSPTCPGCHGPIDVVVGTPTTVEEQDRSVLLLGCPACGQVLGAAPT